MRANFTACQLLDVASAVPLCWLGMEEGYAMETASAPDGPWTLSDATPFVQDGQICVAVPATSKQQFFRLVKT